MILHPLKNIKQVTVFVFFNFEFSIGINLVSYVQIIMNRY